MVFDSCTSAGQACQGSLVLLITQPCFQLVKTKNFCWQRAYSTSSHPPEWDEHSYGGIQYLSADAVSWAPAWEQKEDRFPVPLWQR